MTYSIAMQTGIALSIEIKLLVLNFHSFCKRGWKSFSRSLELQWKLFRLSMKEHSWNHFLFVSIIWNFVTILMSLFNGPKMKSSFVICELRHAKTFCDIRSSILPFKNPVFSMNLPNNFVGSFRISTNEVEWFKDWFQDERKSGNCTI